MFIGKHFGRFEIRSKLGAGGMGEVYVAHDPELDREVAVKILPAEFSQDENRKSRFRQEARAVSALNHPNIITIYETGENEHGSFLVTELVDGKTLREIEGSESLSLIRVIRIAEQVCNALIAAHSAHIIHRDIKPENIMLRRDGIAKVLDFGLAKPSVPTLPGANANQDQAMTIPGMVMGSARYMSPEQARGLAVDERTDLWSLGVVLYEMATGHSPFNGATTSDTIAAVIFKEPEPLLNLVPDAPPELQRILRKALQKDRELRYQSAKDLGLDLKDLLYSLEHQISGERMRAGRSDPELSENPTLIHQTSSANISTRMNAVSTVGTGAVATKPRRSFGTIAFACLGGLVVLAALAFGAYHWFGPKRTSLATFEKTQVSRIDTDGKVLLPAISPDGKYVAYASGEAGQRTLVVRQLATDSLLTIVPPTNLDFRFITFAPSGDYIYYTQTRGDFSVNTLYQVPTLGGTSKKLIEDVDSAVSFAPDAKHFVFIRHTSQSNQDLMFIVDAASLEMNQLISSKQTEFDFFSARPAWSPDGKRILIGGGKRQGGFTRDMKIAEIYLNDRSVKLIGNKDWYTVGSFVWQKDGSSFLFAGRETQNAPVQIWRGTYPVGEIQPVTNDFNDYSEVGLTAAGDTIVTIKGETVSSLWQYTPATKEVIQFTADGRDLDGYYGIAQMPDGRLVYTQKAGNKAEVWVSDSDGKNAHSIAADLGYITNVKPTADGRYLVFAAQNRNSSRIWRMDVDGKNLVALTADDPDQGDFNPQLTPDGKAVLFQRNTAGQDRFVFMKVPVSGGAAELFYADEASSVALPKISPDGKRLAFSSYDIATFARKLRIGAISETGVTTVEKEFPYNLIDSYEWSIDGQSLTILTSRDGAPNLQHMPLDGGPVVPLTQFSAGRIFGWCWSNDHKHIYLSRGNVNNDLLLIRDSATSGNR